VRQNHRIIRVDAFEGAKLSHGETVSGKATGRPPLEGRHPLPLGLTGRRLGLQSRLNASPFWVILLLSVGALEHRMIKHIAVAFNQPEHVRLRQPAIAVFEYDDQP
jgi:hypothetical protein